jgi:hypothetical protein
VLDSIVANRTDHTVPDLFSIEIAGSSIIVRGVRASGDITWTASASGYPLMGDSFGGLVAGTNRSVDIYGDHSASFVRFGGPAGSPGWRYDSPGRISTPAQASDGTIYTVERYPIGVNNFDGTPIIETQVVVIDGLTGGVRARYPLARERRGLPCAFGGWEASPRTLGPIVGTDGYGYLLVRRWTDQRLSAGNCSTQISQDVGVDLLRVSPSGVVTATAIYSQHCGPGPITICDEPPQLKEIFPDGIGGTLVRALITTSVTTQQVSREMRIMRVADGTVQFNNTVDFDERITMIGDAATAFLAGDDVRAVDVTNWTSKWVDSNTSLEPVVALPNGKSAMHDVVSGELIEFSATGTRGQSASFGGHGGYQSSLGNWIAVDASHQLSARVSLSLTEASTSFTFLRGRGDRQNAIRVPNFVQFVPADQLSIPPLELDGPYAARHLERDFRADISARRTIGNATFFNEAQAAAQTFLTEAKKQVDALAFIGHSVLINEHPEWVNRTGKVGGPLV